jgi:putative Mg2+ transporter-C (MgtC) family protein
MARIAAQIVSGIGFLGAGVILREGLNVRGLNTAATLWCSAAAGTLAGAGEYVLACVTTAAILAINLGLQPLVNLVNRAPGYAFNVETAYTVVVQCQHGAEAEVRAALLAPTGKHGVSVSSMTSGRVSHPICIEISLKLHLPARNDAAVDRVLAELTTRPDVISTKWAIGTMTE